MNVGIRLGHNESLRARPMIEAMSLLLSTWSFSRPEHESAFARLGHGRDPLYAAMHVADAVEADPEVDSVGYGGLPDASGGVSLDALVMRSPAEHGSVIAMTKVRQAAAAARLVMEKSPHRIIAGSGADAFAMQHGLPAEELVAARDDCGAPTLRLQLAQMALLYAHLGASNHAELEQISRAMLAHPDLVAGDGRFDTELMRRGHGQVLSKGGAEGIQCLTRVGEGLGVAIKVEDGSRRAKQAVALYLLRELDWLTPMGLEELEEQVLIINPGVTLEVHGALEFRKS